MERPADGFRGDSNPYEHNKDQQNGNSVYKNANDAGQGNGNEPHGGPDGYGHPGDFSGYSAGQGSRRTSLQGQQGDNDSVTSPESSGHPPQGSEKPSEKEPRKLQRPIQRGAQACSQCRQHKIKCIPSSTEEPFPCSRCVNQGLVCEVLKHNRGRKRKNTEGEALPKPKRTPAVYYPGQDGAVDPTLKLSTTKSRGSNSSSAPPGPPQLGDSSASSTFPSLPPSSDRTSRVPNLSVNTSTSGLVPPSTQGTLQNAAYTSPVYDTKGHNLHVLEQAIAMHGRNGNTGLPGSAGPHSALPPLHMPYEVPGSHHSTSYQQPSVLNQQHNSLGPLSAQVHDQRLHPLHSSVPPSQHLSDTHGISSHSPRLHQSSRMGSTHLPLNTGTLSSVPPDGVSPAISKPILPYQYGAANYALPPPRPSGQAQHVFSQRSQMHAPYPTTSATLQPTLPSPQYPYTGQPNSTYTGINQASVAFPSSAESAPAGNSTGGLITGQSSKGSGSPTRIQDNILADAQSAGLESLKFPFLLPNAQRVGRRGMFTITSIVRPEDVEEIGPGSAGKNLDHASLLVTDPIQAGVLTLEDARTLFQLYMDEMSVLNCLLDPTIHTHDFVRSRSKFLYTAILSVISRYLNSTTYTSEGQPRRLISPVYAYCKQAAKAHLKEVLGNVECDLEVIQGLAVLTFHKEPEDEKACLHLYRAIAIARETGIDQETLKDKEDLDEDQKRWIRVKQRVWLSLFVANTILTMQFDMNTLIGPDDTAIAASSRFALGSHLQTDTLLCASVQLRRLWHIYSDMTRALEHVGETNSEKAAKLVSLSMLTRTANRELEQAASSWKEECIAVGLVRIDSKISVWVSAIKLRLNLAIVQMALPGLKERASMISNGFLPPKKANADVGQSIELGCINAFHQSVNSACHLLQCMPVLEEKRLLSFAADTFLSFSVYSAFFLWTLCRDMGHSLLEPGEVDHCFALISSAAAALESASLYPGDSCALHARFLRNLQATRAGENQKSGDSVVGDGSLHPLAVGMATDAMRGSPASQKNESKALPPSHPLSILSQMQVPQSEPARGPVENQGGWASTGGYPLLGDGSQQINGIAPSDAMLMADWGTMQRDFPWVSSDIVFPFLDASVPSQMQPMAFPEASQPPSW